VVERQPLREAAARRDAREVCALDAECVEDSEHVGQQVVRRVVRRARLRGRRLAGVARVVADDEAGAGGQTPAELLAPPVHRAGGAADQQDRGVGWIAERLDA
jgi:hypothetical protein